MHLGIDIGGTTARVSAFESLDSTTELGGVQFKISKNKDPWKAFKKDITRLVHHSIGLSERFGVIGKVGVALAGKLDADRQMLTGTGNLHHWVKKRVAEGLSEELGCPVFLGNDAEAAAMAEARYGYGQGTDFWFVIWGTGVGGCLVRRVRDEPVAFPAEVGHQRVADEDLRKCGCGQEACLDFYCGGNGLSQIYGVSAERAFAEVGREIAETMLIGLRNIVAIQPVPLIVFGGGIANKQSQWIEYLQRRLRDELQIVDAPEVKLSHFGESAGTVGALSLIPG